MKQTYGKLPKGVTDEFIDTIASASSDDLKALIVTLQVQNQENEAFKLTPGFLDAQEEFLHAKERFELVAGPVKDATVSVKNRTKLVVERLQDKGAV